MGQAAPERRVSVVGVVATSRASPPRGRSHAQIFVPDRLSREFRWLTSSGPIGTRQRYRGRARGHRRRRPAAADHDLSRSLRGRRAILRGSRCCSPQRSLSRSRADVHRSVRCVAYPDRRPASRSGVRMALRTQAAQFAQRSCAKVRPCRRRNRSRPGWSGADSGCCGPVVRRHPRDPIDAPCRAHAHPRRRDPGVRLRRVAHRTRAPPVPTPTGIALAAPRGSRSPRCPRRATAGPDGRSSIAAGRWIITVASACADV